ncbi:MAG: ABC transporter ATP-binding protein [Lachnospiraceae bacterium]|jgi:peptide/nickel transport system ATP-binding protein|nr:ABC transporter ATP-binding protein [Lachnospiraceae bacterium]
MEKEILRIERLSVSFSQYGRGLARRRLSAVEELSLSVYAGEIVAVVGSSGSGKSLLAHAVMGILPYNGRLEGRIWFNGEPLTQKRAAKLRGKELCLVPQNVSYLDPLMRVGEQVTGGRSSPSRRGKCKSVLAGYGLEAGVERKYPFQLSGGMIRRILISTAVMETPKLVIADEPTPGLHPEAAGRVMGHFKEIAKAGAGVLLITHDLELALLTADRVVVLYGGRMIEEAPASAFSDETKLSHPYTRALCRSMPKNWNPDGERLCDTGDILSYMRKEYGR